MGFTARMKRMNEKIASSTVEHYTRMQLEIEPNWHVVFLLLKEKKRLTVTEMASSLGFSHPALIKITQKMKSKGYLERHKDSNDGRKTQLQLSKKGESALAHLEAEWQKIEEILKELVPADFLKQLNYLEMAFDERSFRERYDKRFNSRPSFTIRNARESEFKKIGKLMVEVYSSLEGFPKPSEQPAYYDTLANIGGFTKKPNTQLLVAISHEGNLLGAVLYFDDMQYYGSGGTATQEKNASGFRLLAVSPSARGLGVGKALSETCIKKAKSFGNHHLIIHTTDYMKIAWKIYENLGFIRYSDLDFKQGDLKVYGFRLKLDQP